ncbi:tumor necrosis factor receptor superfamily member 5 isoform X2 [Alligator sinensis]|uniref:Tumor necrosis factor receptor superfamily member 5 n=1 Tax=Alligator sinensis TaxID=38654 RepID=A0A3Q0FKC6_ALLSI|nr:tumor necrosis factor receptor superfamily member 5 isoform X2 [Alligator sinensis]
MSTSPAAGRSAQQSTHWGGSTQRSPTCLGCTRDRLRDAAARPPAWVLRLPACRGLFSPRLAGRGPREILAGLRGPALAEADGEFFCGDWAPVPCSADWLWAAPALSWAAAGLQVQKHLAAGTDIQCSERQYVHEGRCCYRCAPGQKVTAACSEASGLSTCAHCEVGSFQAHWTKENHCVPHRYCDPNVGLVVKTPGSEKEDVTCGCQVGMHCTSAQCQTCKLNPRCEPGFGVVPRAQEDAPPTCQPCPDGSFSNVTSDSKPCQPWSRCEEKGLVKKENGTRSSDVVCEPQRSSPSHPLVLVLFSILAGIAICALGLFLCLHRRGFQRQLQKQGHPQVPLDREDTMLLNIVKTEPRPEPSEEDEMPSEQTIPVQETMVGRQPVAQEDGKESHVSEQERP